MVPVHRKHVLGAQSALLAILPQGCRQKAEASACRKVRRFRPTYFDQVPTAHKCFLTAVTPVPKDHLAARRHCQCPTTSPAWFDVARRVERRTTTRERRHRPRNAPCNGSKTAPDTTACLWLPARWNAISPKLSEFHTPSIFADPQRRAGSTSERQTDSKHPLFTHCHPLSFPAPGSPNSVAPLVNRAPRPAARRPLPSRGTDLRSSSRSNRYYPYRRLFHRIQILRTLLIILLNLKHKPVFVHAWK